MTTKKKPAPIHLGDPTAQDKVFVPGPGRIFVFGSNEAGIHGAGAAATAFKEYGAEWHNPEGLQGQSYAIPTKDQKLETLTLRAVQKYINKFLAFAQDHPELYFFVTRIGCGLAGFLDAEMAPLFRDAPANCELPHGWR